MAINARAQEERRRMKRNESYLNKIKGGLRVFLSTYIALTMVFSPALLSVAHAAPAATDLEQCRNGSAASHQDCIDSTWQAGNAGSTNSHYVEGESIPYRSVLTNLPTGTPITITYGYDIKHSDKHAIDYLTQYDRTDVNVDPINDIAAATGAPNTFPIPAPSSAGSPVVGQPTASFNALPAAERVMSIWNGSISGMSYATEGDLTAAKDDTTISITFSATDPTVVLAWGGHIGSRLDWGFDTSVPRSAGGISGSPYHMRIMDWTEGNLGNTDRSLSADAVLPPNPSTLTLVKTVVNDNGGTAAVADFPLFIGDTQVASGAANAVEAGDYVVSETTSPSYSASIWGGDCDATGHVTIAAGDNKTCTITNDDNSPSLTLNKVVTNDNGGTTVASAWTLTAAGPTGFSGAGPVVNNAASFDAGTYALSESGPSGYAASSWVCVGGTQDGASITLALGQNASCTITNDDIQPKLTVTKIVVNDNGGTKTVSDFPLFVGQTSVTSGVQNGFSAGAYVVSETNQSGYTATITGDCDAEGNVTLALGENKSCTITNDDQTAWLTIVKTIIKDDGGTITAFELFVGTVPVLSGALNAFDAGAYLVSETNIFGYLAGLWGGDCATDGSITLANGDNKTCTITNDDVAPQLTVIKHVVNDNGGSAVSSDFTMNVTGTDVSNSSFAGAEDPGVTVTLDAGSYSVDEVDMSGYAKTLGTDCSGTIAVGESKTCTITNDDIQPELTVTKVVVNDNGGTSVVSDFPLFVGETSVTSGEQNGFDADSYVVSETNQTGYTAVISGDCDANGNVTLSVGDEKSCTITNNDEPATITVNKVVINDNGGTAHITDFPLFVDDQQVTSGVPIEVNAGNHEVTETNLPGYASNYGLDCDSEGTSHVSVTNGEDLTCTITNDDITATITVTKLVVNDNEGTAQASDFPLHVGEGDVTTGVTYDINPGTYGVWEDQLEGYTQTGVDGDCNNEGIFTVALGENKNCTITNNDNVPVIPESLPVTVNVEVKSCGSIGDPKIYGTTVEVTISNAGGATVEVRDSEGNIVATFTESGSQILPQGTYTFTVVPNEGFVLAEGSTAGSEFALGNCDPIVPFDLPFLPKTGADFAVNALLALIATGGVHAVRRKKKKI